MPHAPLPPVSVPRPIAGLKNTSDIVQVMFCDAYELISTGGRWAAYASANGLNTVGVSGALSNTMPAGFNKYCGIYAQYTVL
jgi:hypothetical protein